MTENQFQISCNKNRKQLISNIFYELEFYVTLICSFKTLYTQTSPSFSLPFTAGLPISCFHVPSENVTSAYIHTWLHSIHVYVYTIYNVWFLHVYSSLVLTSMPQLVSSGKHCLQSETCLEIDATDPFSSSRRSDKTLYGYWDILTD